MKRQTIIITSYPNHMANHVIFHKVCHNHNLPNTGFLNQQVITEFDINL